MTAPARSASVAHVALRYAEKGWPIFPLQVRGKKPFEEGGFHRATSELAQVRLWWAKWPDANIGFRPAGAGLVVIDVDGPEGERQAQGLGLLAEPTLEVVTGRNDGGRHRYYKHPGGVVPNAKLAPSLDVRGDNGYVILPPSVHPSGAVYRWLGRVEEIAELPPGVVARLRTTGTAEAPKPDQVPAWMIPWLEVGEGGRNSTLTRFVGWAFAQGHDIATVQAMALGVNASWRDPLPREEVDAAVRSIGAREASKPKRRTDTGQVLQVVRDEPKAEREITPAELAQGQLSGAIDRGRIDLSRSPRWMWADLHALTGPMLPGDLVVVGALTGNGKTSYLMSQMDWAAERGIATVYLGLEKDPTEIRRQWAAWKLGLEWKHVHRNDWHLLPVGAQDAHETMMAEQAENPHVQFPPDKRVHLSTLAKWCEWGVREIGCKWVVVDHFHRMDFGRSGANYRVEVTEAARSLKDLARKHELVLTASAQLNQTGAEMVLDKAMPPQLRRLKESSGLSEECDLVLMLSRRLRGALDAETLRAIKSGLKNEREVMEPNTMQVTCRKHRLDDEACDRSVLLHVERGRVENRAESYREHVLG